MERISKTGEVKLMGCNLETMVNMNSFRMAPPLRNSETSKNAANKMKNISVPAKKNSPQKKADMLKVIEWISCLSDLKKVHYQDDGNKKLVNLLKKIAADLSDESSLLEEKTARWLEYCESTFKDLKNVKQELIGTVKKMRSTQVEKVERFCDTIEKEQDN